MVAAAAAGGGDASSSDVSPSHRLPSARPEINVGQCWLGLSAVVRQIGTWSMVLSLILW